MERHFDELFFDFRTGGYTRNVIVFPSENSPTGEEGYSPEYFASHSEHVEMSADA